jgi:16S rRNA (adenine1518-N6/adenine1519-N6)-dimethyltransferase
VSLTNQVKTVLKQLSTHPRKRMSQNFMVSETALEVMVHALCLKSGDTVLEIGAGLGFLTELLSRSAKKIIAVEMDKRFCGYLSQRFGSGSNVQVLQSDILQYTPSAKSLKCIGNIPYQVTSPLLEWLIRNRRHWTSVLLTVQREIAVRLTAKEGMKDRSSLTCWVGLHAAVERLTDFKPNVFYPQPAVDSSLIRLKFYPQPLYPSHVAKRLHQLIRLTFQQRRKTLINSLSQDALGFTKEQVRDSLLRSEIGPQARPEELTLRQWVHLGQEIAR